MERIFIKNLFDLSHSAAGEYLSGFMYPWEALNGIADFIVELGNKIDKSEYVSPAPNIWIHKTANIYSSAFVVGPCIVGAYTEIRHCAFIRGGVLIGENCVVGNSSEVKNSIIFDNVQIPHFNYVGDSILGYKSHMGAGAITSNVKSDKTDITVKYNDKVIETGMRKVGAMLGDYVEVGCNSVLNPGTIIGRNSNIYPICSVRGVINENSIYKADGIIIEKK